MLDLAPQTQSKSQTQYKALWSPQSGPQEALVHCPFGEVFFGGARGGGKTDGVLGKWMHKERQYGANFNAMMFRKTTKASDDAIERAKELYLPLGAEFNESKLRFRMPNGGRVGFGYLETVADANAWQGRNLSDAWVEEAGLYPDSAPIMRLFGVLRSAHGVPVQLILTANPGGPGQHWIRLRYKLYPFPANPLIIDAPLPNGETHKIAVIPSRLTDNKLLLASDPGYVNRLYLVGSAALVKAWLEGDWSAIEGAYFDNWDNQRHIIKPFQIPSHWRKFRACDWGSAKPFSVGWYATVGEDCLVHKRLLKRNALIRYREYYGMQQDKPNVGLKLHAPAVALNILKLDGADGAISDGVIDPAAFAENGGPSIAESMMGVKFEGRSIIWRAADNKRLGSNGAMGGWDQLRARLAGDTDGNPLLIFFDTCHQAIRTIPVLQHDATHAEDLDTDGEDHAADEVRYACMSRPITVSLPESAKPNKVGYSHKTYSRNVSNELVI